MEKDNLKSKSPRTLWDSHYNQKVLFLWTGHGRFYVSGGLSPSFPFLPPPLVWSGRNGWILAQVRHINAASRRKTHTLPAHLCSHHSWVLNRAELSLYFPWNPQLTEDLYCPPQSFSAVLRPPPQSYILSFVNNPHLTSQRKRMATGQEFPPWASALSNSKFYPFIFNVYLFIGLHWVLVVACRIFSCGMWDPLPWPRIEPGPPALGKVCG